ncbi:hypothetical protein HMSSN036_04830 [Paenibacillus macerans]|nr:hypothetical protein HMSSN036_04830 [Paenibacillus macerans]
MQFKPIYYNGKLFLPEIELNMTSNQAVGIITDLKRKQLLLNQLADHSQYYLFRAGQSEYMRLTVEELITFLIKVTERNERAALLMDYFALQEERKGKNQGSKPLKKDVCDLAACLFCVSAYFSIGGTLFLLGRRRSSSF